jgi:uncharacterized protein YbjT (DUF2867 family)
VRDPALARNPDSAGLPDGVEVVRGDLADPGALDACLDGSMPFACPDPQVLTQVEQVHVIGEAIGRALRFEEISPEAARQKMLTAGWPPLVADSQLNAYALMATEPMLATTTVKEITGTPARTFREWAFDHADDFRWPPTTGNR